MSDIQTKGETPFGIRYVTPGEKESFMFEYKYHTATSTDPLSYFVKYTLDYYADIKEFMDDKLGY